MGEDIFWCSVKVYSNRRYSGRTCEAGTSCGITVFYTQDL